MKCSLGGFYDSLITLGSLGSFDNVIQMRQYPGLGWIDDMSVVAISYTADVINGSAKGWENLQCIFQTFNPSFCR